VISYGGKLMRILQRQPDGIGHRAIPLEEALPIARQIAEALEAAHEQGIIHRDLKPANIKVRPDGAVKVLDFGLAKPLAAESENTPVLHLADSPTITSPAMGTSIGMILGTAAYMSPEQAKGHAVDRRADLWAFGAVLYEMLTGRRAFPGEQVSETLAHVLMQDPDWTALPARTPAPIVRLLRRCLEKDRKRRLDSAAAARLDVEEAMSAAREATHSSRDQRPRWQRALPWTAAGVLGVSLVIVLLAGNLRRTASPLAPVRMNAALGADASLAAVDRGAAAVLSPNGQVVAFVAQPRNGAPSLYVRRLDQLEATRLAGTDGAHSPFFAPDSEWIGFFADAKLKKVALSGSAPVALCDISDARGGTWAADRWIAFGPFNSGGLLRVSSSGGTPEPLTTLADGEVLHGWPQVLPGSRAVLYAASNSSTNWDDATLIVQPLPTGPRKIVQRGGYYGRYLPSGQIVYVHRGTLFAVPFDLDLLELSGPPVSALNAVASNSNGGSAQVATSDTGTLIYQSGSNDTAAAAGTPIEWMDRTGRRTPLRSMPANWGNPQFSPDGTRLAIEINDGKQLDVWVYEWADDRPHRLTLGAARNQKPVWTPDGRRIVFWSNRDKDQNLYWRRADGTGDVERLTHSQYPQSAGHGIRTGRSSHFRKHARRPAPT
jgi:Tol biopolymer transport system component